MALSRPPKIVPLDSGHDRDGFSCGDVALDGYIRRQASQDVSRNIAQVWVAVDPSVPSTEQKAVLNLKTPILGYYTLSATSFAKSELPAELAKRLPHYPVPAAILGRLAINKSLQKQGLGKFLIFDVFNRVVQSSQQLGIHALIVDAKYPHIVPIYTKYGFQAFPNQPQRLFISVKTLAKA